MIDDLQYQCDLLSVHADPAVRAAAAEIVTLGIQLSDAFVKAEATNSTLSAKIKVLAAEIKRLKTQLKNAQRAQYGKKSEKSDTEKDTSSAGFDDGDPETDDEDEIPDDGNEPSEPEEVPNTGTGKNKKNYPSHQRRESREFQPRPDQLCDCCCGHRDIGEEIRERLAYREAELFVIEEIYCKKVCRNCGQFAQHPVPERPFDGSGFDTSLFVAVLIKKYADFLPLNRITEIFGRKGVKIHRSTLSRLMKKAKGALKWIYESLLADIKSSSKLHMDETHLGQMFPGLGKLKTCRIWALCRDDRRWKGNKPPAVAFRYTQTREGVNAEDMLLGFDGVLQVDAYGGYNRLTSTTRIGEPLMLAYCWAHVRRKFWEELQSNKDKTAGKLIDMIGKLYGIEKDLKGQAHIVREATRLKESTPIVDQIFACLRNYAMKGAMKTKMGEAVSYALKLEDGLRVFLQDGRVEIDNNNVENTIRPIVQLRKASLFTGSADGGETWAIIASLVGTCRLNDIDPHAYITWVFEKFTQKVPRSQYDKLLPWHFGEEVEINLRQ
ncbi:IS66 family transposase [Tateyamaria sp. SN6-1]|uniref:IS66 family transposase n=1 Tax=Tateyamaria sp. SN6-1 TaxID=3092148 RepID=UPI0039F481FE